MSIFRRCDRCKTTDERSEGEGKQWIDFYKLELTNVGDSNYNTSQEIVLNDICEECAMEIRQFARNIPDRKVVLPEPETPFDKDGLSF